MTAEAPSQQQRKQRWMLASTALNALLALAKLVWGIYSGSTVVLADAIHSISDVAGAALVYAAVRLAPHRSRRFPLGLYKLEDMAAVVAGIAVVFAGYEILRSVFVGPGVSASRVPLLTLAFMGVLLLIQLAFYLLENRAARQLDSPGIRSDVANWLGDIGAGLVVIAGITGQYLQIPHVQEIAVVIIALLIFHSAYGVLRDGLLSLLDASVAPSQQARARQFLESLPYIHQVRELILRKAGSVYFLQATVQVNTQGLEQAHEWADDIERQLKAMIPGLEKVVIHYEPIKTDRFRIARLYEGDRSHLAANFARSQWIELVDYPLAENGKTKQPQETASTHWTANPFGQDGHGKSIKLAVWLIRHQVNRVELAGDDPTMDTPALKELLSAAGIELVLKTDSTLSE